MIIELTGVPCVGKSSFLQKLQGSDQDVVVADNTYVLRMTGLNWLPNFLRSVAVESILFFYLVIFRPLSFHQFKFIVKHSFGPDASFLIKLRVLRRALVTFALISFAKRKSAKSSAVVIDEGIAHLLFRFQQEGQDISAIWDFVRDALVKSESKVVVLDGRELNLKERLLSRGHRRVDGKDESAVDAFIALNHATLKRLLEVMEDDDGIPYTVIDPSEQSAAKRFRDFAGC